MISTLARPLRLVKPALSSRLSCPQSSPLPAFVRLQSVRNATTSSNNVPRQAQKHVQAAEFAQRGRLPNKYPERLLIFHSPTPVSAMTGLSKASTIMFFGVFGCLIAAPNVYYNPEMPLWMTPAVIVVSAIPMALVSVLTAPFVAGVFIRLPDYARKSSEALQSFLTRLPADTRLDVQKMGFLPFPRTRSLQLSELRPLTSRILLANLEHVPRANAGKQDAPAWLRIVRGYLWTRPNPSHWEKTLAPQAWPLVMEHVRKKAVAAGLPAGEAVASPRAGRALPTPAAAMPRGLPLRDSSKSSVVKPSKR